MKNIMEFEHYLEKCKLFVKNTSIWQRILFAVVLFVILGGVVFWINPAKKLLEMRNSQRRSDVVNILNSVYQYSLDNGGNLPKNLTSESVAICKSKAASCENLIDISEIINNKKYLLSEVPVDPQEKDANSSGYQIAKLSNGRIRVSAPLAENGAVINLSK